MTASAEVERRNEAERAAQAEKARRDAIASLGRIALRLGQPERGWILDLAERLKGQAGGKAARN